ncbi:MAG: ATP:cob(I)alamin adenosyltransferase [Candidatus Magasanikbacteria bacterium CG_4_10_14_0_8_um_filter_32_14]|uniref:Corrinoid adenosyltransferase n=2 Tax=Candidatus Magasanikiibacteriota TaxID=1752731 RepID=A0A2M7R9H1_9BACT|nr:MAG: ATP:cob(I)alamin adenosyltransferase [Candidatus Magasanikbacteria bacterium CG1_02_32_51]PIY93393.1 MAG: ATP:cob(I)alamin adenosyltransferase [Candidatus Magasanikbacteria bacterium CG_4_10_14_0_8_um_filter_32_14]
MKIYTRAGDKGQTTLLGGKRVAKNCLEMDAIGEIDELNSTLGLLISYLQKKQTKELKILINIQNNLFNIGASLAAVQTKLTNIPKIKKTATDKLEKYIDDMSEQLPILNQFILPGGSIVASLAFQARAICRRAERVIVDLNSKYKLDKNILIFINRLSDFLFMLGRYFNQQNNVEEITWKK